MSASMHKSSDEQREGMHGLYRDKGFVLLENFLPPSHLSLLRDWLVHADSITGPSVVTTAHGELQAVYGAHLLNPAVARIPAYPPLHQLLREFIGDDFYLYQTQVHLKPLSSSTLDWHQDFRAYHDYDGLAEPCGAIVGTFLDDICSEMAPVEVIPGSHKKGLLHSAHDSAVPAKGPSAGREGRMKFRVGHSELTTAFGEFGTVQLTGCAGSIFICHPCLVHRSGTNSSGRRRAIVYTNVFGVKAIPTDYGRPECVVARDHSPIRPSNGQ